MKFRISSILFVTLAALAWLVPSAALAGDAAAGKEKYTMFCATCHGETGTGDGPGATGLPTPPRDFSKGEFKFDADANGTPGEDADLALVISKGAAAYGGSPLMTPWAGAVSDEDITNLVAYIHSLKK